MDESLLDAARMARSHLPELLAGDAEAQRHLDKRIAGLLHRANRGTDVTDELHAAIGHHRIVQAWVADVRRDPHRRPPDLRPGHRSGVTYSPVPGDVQPPDAPRYACPEGDYLWFRRHVGQQIPLCPTHRLPLVPG
jgi:hypothetical protein